MSDIHYNIVLYSPLDSSGKPVGAAFPLTLSEPWKLSCGLKPNVNQARISYVTWNELKQYVRQPGQISMWYNHGPHDGDNFKPDVLLSPVRIVGIRGGQIAGLIGGEGEADLIDPVRAPVDWLPCEYTLFFHDYRTRFVEPRGGRLRLGLINPGPKVPHPVQGFEDQTNTRQMTMSECMLACLDAMGVDVGLPDFLDDLDPPRDLRWLGSHAPTELQKLLDQAGCVFVPGLVEGNAYIDQITSQVEIPIPGTASFDDRLPDVPLPDTDLRGTAVIFCGYPSQALVTETSGYGQPTDSAEDDPNKWEYVAQDKDDEWKNIEDDDFELLKGLGGLRKAVRNELRGVDPQHEPRLRSQLFRFIRLRDDAWPTRVSPLQKIIVEEDSIAKLGLTADKAAYWFPGATYGHVFRNSPGPTNWPVTELLDGNILKLAAPLYTVDAASIIGGFTNFDKQASFVIRYTVGDYDDPGDGDPDQLRPRFYHIGFTRPGNTGELVKMEDADVEAVLEGDGQVDTRMYTRPAMRLLTVDDAPVNDKDLEDAARSEAERYFAGLESPARLVRVRGYAAMEPSGAMAEVEWDQHKVMTSGRANDWYTLDGILRQGDLAKMLQTVKAGGW